MSGSAVRSAVSPAEARAVFRAELCTPTAGWCAGWTRANLLAVPRELAYDVLLFSCRNPAACPVLDVTEPGSFSTQLFPGDLRTDLPAYRVYRHDELVDEVTDAGGAVVAGPGGIPNRVQLHLRDRVAGGGGVGAPP